MRTWRDVARYHLVVPWAILLIPWAILTVSFIVNLVIFSLAPVGHHDALTSQGLVQVATLRTITPAEWRASTSSSS
jgi:hypothetical protein